MKRLYSLLAFVLTFCVASLASAKLGVVASVPALGALVREVGGQNVDVTTLAGPTQDPHFVDGRPSYVVKLNKADLLVYVGLALEIGWLPPLVDSSRNAKIQLGQIGNLDASTVAGKLLDRKGAEASRKEGDVHPEGNPHYLYSPLYAVRVADGIAARLAKIDPGHAADYKKNAAAFKHRLAKKVAGWEASMARYRGRSVVGFHESLVYLASWLGLERKGFVEPYPGISPNPKHLAKLIIKMRKEKVKLILSEPWYNAETTRVVAQKTGAKIVNLPGDVGAPGIKTYDDFIDHIVTSLRAACDQTADGG